MEAMKNFKSFFLISLCSLSILTGCHTVKDEGQCPAYNIIGNASLWPIEYANQEKSYISIHNVHAQCDGKSIDLTLQFMTLHGIGKKEEKTGEIPCFAALIDEKGNILDRFDFKIPLQAQRQFVQKIQYKCEHCKKPNLKLYVGFPLNSHQRKLVSDYRNSAALKGEIS